MKLGIILLTFFLTQSIAFASKFYCTPEQSCWPSSSEWETLNKQVNGHLIKGNTPLNFCYRNAQSSQCSEVLEQIKNPFYIEQESGLTQSNGWFKAWTNQVSDYVLVAQSAEEIAKAVQFAHKHHIKIVVKGTGHDYLGRSNASDSLLIWTHSMRNITIDDQFIPHGCHKAQKPVASVTVEAGIRWLEAYKKVIVEHGRYVQGGGCTSVGAAGGFIQGGGFGSFSKKFGTGAAGIVEAEVITANGTILIANACQNKDLFWALKGGGGGTYGIVSKITLQTHPLPTLFGAFTGTIQAKSDEDYKRLINYFTVFYAKKLHNEHWGEQVSFTPENRMQLALVFQGLTQTEVETLWQPFKEWLSNKSNQYQFTFKILTLPAEKFWDYEYLSKNLPSSIKIDRRNRASYGEFWWAGNQAEVSLYLTHYQSGYLPFKLFSSANVARLSAALFKASRLTNLSLHFNKGLAGASLDALERQKNTAMNPAVLNAAALVIIAGGQQYAYPKIVGHELDQVKAKISAKKARQAMKLIHHLAPDAGTYGNEADYFLSDWQHALWGTNYSHLLKIKKRYDPDNLLTCHHCVGSEENKRGLK
jgi:FAD/FMN-containing dehydrogenase